MKRELAGRQREAVGSERDQRQGGDGDGLMGDGQSKCLCAFTPKNS